MHAVIGAISDQVVVFESDWPFVLHDRRRRAAHRGDPFGQLAHVAYGGRKAHELHVVRQVDDYLLPHGSPVCVLKEMDLVDNYRGEPAQITT